jgi:hypothetical protein
LAELNQGEWELIRTGIYSPGAGIGGKDLYYDDPKARHREAKNMSQKRREKFAKWYLHKVFEAEEKRLWFRRMTNPSLHKIYKDTYESGGKIPL